jgi:hypothetical protein
VTGFLIVDFRQQAVDLVDSPAIYGSIGWFDLPFRQFAEQSRVYRFNEPDLGGRQRAENFGSHEEWQSVCIQRLA